jgi:dTDP-4-amino-4,6-dideoxygalactose transaminase
MAIAYLDLHALNDHLVEEFQEKIGEIVASGQYTLGPAVQRFEEQFAKFGGAKFGVGTNSGTDSLLISLAATGVGAGDEVVLPVIGPSYLAETVARLGAKPVFVDVQAETLNLDPDLAISSLTSRTKAMVVLHHSGLAAEMDRIMNVARTYSMTVIEEMSHAVGGRFHNRRLGTFGMYACYGFAPDNALGALGSAGIVTTSDEAAVESLRRLRDHGRSANGGHEVLGYDSHMDAVQAAFLSLKLGELEDNILDRIANAKLYGELLAGSPVQTPPTREDLSHTYHTYTIQVSERESLIEHLKEKGIETRVPQVRPLHLETAFKYLEYKEGAFPVAENIARSALSLPVYPGLKKQQIKHVASAILDFYGVTA